MVFNDKIWYSMSSSQWQTQDENNGHHIVVFHLLANFLSLYRQHASLHNKDAYIFGNSGQKYTMVLYVYNIQTVRTRCHIVCE